MAISTEKRSGSICTSPRDLIKLPDFMLLKTFYRSATSIHLFLVVISRISST